MSRYSNNSYSIFCFLHVEYLFFCCRLAVVVLYTLMSSGVSEISNYAFTLQHGTISRIGNGEDVRRHLVSLDAFVPFHDLLCVYRQSLVGIYHDAEEARVCLQQEQQQQQFYFIYTDSSEQKTLSRFLPYTYIYISL